MSSHTSFEQQHIKSQRLLISPKDIHLREHHGIRAMLRMV